MTKAEAESVKKNINLYMFGEKIKDFWNHPIIKPAINATKMSYELLLSIYFEGQ